MLFVTSGCNATRGVRGSHVLSNALDGNLDGCHENGTMGFTEGKIWKISFSLDIIWKHEDELTPELCCVLCPQLRQFIP